MVTKKSKVSVVLLAGLYEDSSRADSNVCTAFLLLILVRQKKCLVSGNISIFFGVGK